MIPMRSGNFEMVKKLRKIWRWISSRNGLEILELVQLALMVHFSRGCGENFYCIGHFVAYVTRESQINVHVNAKKQGLTHPQPAYEP